MIVRPATVPDLDAWVGMRVRLYDDATPEELVREAHAMLGTDPPCAAFVAEEEGRLIGFMEVGPRSYAEGGPDEPAGYVEGIWVEPGARRRGVAKALLTAAEAWATEQGFGWLGSDARLDNPASHAWHRAAGFAEVEQLVIFGKPLD